MTYSGFEKMPNNAISNNLNGHRYLHMPSMMGDLYYEVEYTMLCMFLRFKETFVS